MRRRFKTQALALLLAACALLLCGCSWVGDKLNELTQATDPPAEEPLTTALSSPAPTENEAGSDESENPVFTLYSGFLKAERQAFSGLYEAAFDCGEREISSLYLRLLSETARLAEVCSALSMLPEAEGRPGAFSGTVAGVYAGSGSISKDGALEFEFESGLKAAGSIARGGQGELKLKYSGAKLLLSRENGLYALRSDREGQSFIALIGGGGVSAALFPEVLEEEGFPDMDSLHEGALKLEYREGRLLPSE